MEKIKEIIVVEGKNDTRRLQTYFDCDTIETGGDQIVASTIERIAQAQKKRGVIIFTDPDSPGEHIRRWIQAQVPGCKHVFIEKKKARTDKKVGVEHASKADLWAALSQAVTFDPQGDTLSWASFIDMGLIGQSALRQAVCQAFHIGPCNAKTCFKRLNQMHIKEEELAQVVKEVRHG